MKKLFIFLTMVALVATGCNKEEPYENAPPANEPVPPPNPSDPSYTLVRSGTFTGATGQAKVYRRQNGSLLVTLENFSVNNGPDLYVLLSPEPATNNPPSRFLNLGKLRALSGNMAYEIPGNPDFNDFRYCLIYCLRYSHWFGGALLQ